MPNGPVALAAPLLLCASLAIAGDDRDEIAKAREELRRLETEVELLRRRVPPEFDRTEVEASLRKMAEVAGIPAIEMSAGAPPAHLPLQGGAPSGIDLYAVDVRGRAPWAAIDGFVRLVRSRPRAIRLESLGVAPAADRTMGFDARLVFPSLGRDEIEPGSYRGGLLPALRIEVERARALHDALGAYIDPRHGDAVNALATMGSELAETPIAVTALDFDGGLTLRGLLVGSRSREALLAAAEKAGFAVARKEFGDDGRCQSFVLALTLAGAEPSEAEGGVDLFDASAPAFCREKSGAPAKTMVVRGSATPDGETRPAFVLRDVSLRDAFFILNDLIGEGYVVDSDVAGRISLEVLEGASVEETIAAIESAGVAVGSGPVRRVSRTKQPELPAAAGGEEPVTFQFQGADTSDVLCLIGKISEREFRVPRGFRATVSIFATEVQLRDIERAVLASGGLEAGETGRVVSARRPDAPGELVTACENGEPLRRLESAAKSFREFVAADVALAGLARIGDSWRAYLRAPGGRILPVETGSKLFDATVKAVGPERVVMITDDAREIVIP
ncbi:MAG TPA: hypothetical protein VGF40_09165 [Thermoanaerobaculia bacterium]